MEVADTAALISWPGFRDTRVRLRLRASLSIRTTGEHAGWLRLAGAPPQIGKLFGLVALDRLLDFHDNTGAALADV